MIPEELASLLAMLGLPADVLGQFHGSADLEQSIRRSLEGNRYSDTAQRHIFFCALLLILQFYRRYPEITEALHAPWSPVRDECDEPFDRKYVAALEATGSLVLPLRRRARFQTLARYLSSTRGVPGEVAECGTFKGLSAFLICSVLSEERPGFDGAGFHVFDSFEGLSEPTAKDAIQDQHPEAQDLRHMTQKGFFAVSLHVVQQNLAAFPQIDLHPGWIPESFSYLPEAQYRFVHLDVDLYRPTYDCLEYFYDRLAPGGMIVSDDYNWPGARLALKEYANRRGLALELAATGQAVIRASIA
jgi:O-methyltransferase